MSSWRRFLVAFVVVVMGACGDAARAVVVVESDSFVGSPLAVVAVDPALASATNGVSLAADLGGEVQIVNGCLSVVADGIGAVVLVWPDIATAWSSTTGEVTYFPFSGGQVSVSVGDDILMVGDADGIDPDADVEWVNLPCELGASIEVQDIIKR